MRYVVRQSVIDVVGRIWMPAAVCGMRYELTAHDVANIETPITRETVDAWLSTHSGDFQEVLDFRASIEVGDDTVEIEWADPDSEFDYATFDNE